MSTENPLQGPTQQDLEKALRAELVKQQDLLYGIIGGLAAAIICSFLWAGITVITGYKIGYMAIGVGVAVGLGVRYFGAGIDLIYSVIAGIFALVGCALGNLLSQLGFAAQQDSLSYLDALRFLNFEVITTIFRESFSGMDVVFYGIAVSAAYRVGRRNIDEELVKAVAVGKVTAPPYQALRLPVAIVALVMLVAGGYFTMSASSTISEPQTYSYESGEKRALGAIAQGREEGKWEMWWQNGSKQAEGVFNNGAADGAWTYFDENGVMSRTVTYKNGLEDGEATDYFPDGSIRGRGMYKNGRQTGPWVYMHTATDTAAAGSFALDQRDGEWVTYHENGTMNSRGSYTAGVTTGFWTIWHDNGQKQEEIEYDAEGLGKILNTWTTAGKPVIVNGEGEVKIDLALGPHEAGRVSGGFRVGKWQKVYGDGSKWEEGEYKDKVYYLISSWSERGEVLVSNGNGGLETYYEDGSTYESGKYRNGLKDGLWTVYYSGTTQMMSEMTFKDGKVDGVQKSYAEEGYLMIEGSYVGDKREGEWKWYSGDGEVESVVTFVGGKKEGEQMFYNSYGDLMKTEVYGGGDLVGTEVE